MKYTRLSPADYDGKLREMGNYLWALEQNADLASAHQDLSAVAALELRIRSLVEKAENFQNSPGCNPGLAAYIAGLGSRMLREWPRAIAQFQKVVRLEPGNGEAWLELTWCLAEQGRWQASADAARRSTEIFPKAAAAWGNLAIALHRLGHPREADEAIHRAIQLDPSDLRNEQILAILSSTES
jgi:tetratricopeptide (TPR) repeat protein